MVERAVSGKERVIRLGKAHGDKIELTYFPRDAMDYVLGEYTGLVYIGDLLFLFLVREDGSFDVDLVAVHDALDRHLDENIVTNGKVVWERNALIVPSRNGRGIIYCGAGAPELCMKYTADIVRTLRRTVPPFRFLWPRNFKRLPLRVLGSEKTHALSMTGCVFCTRFTIINPDIVVGTRGKDKAVGILGVKDGRPVHYIGFFPFTTPKVALLSAFLDILWRDLLKPKNLDGAEKLMEQARRAVEALRVFERHYGPSLVVGGMVSEADGRPRPSPLDVGVLVLQDGNSPIGRIHVFLGKETVEDAVSIIRRRRVGSSPVREDVLEDLVESGFEPVPLKEPDYIIYRRSSVYVSLRSPSGRDS